MISPPALQEADLQHAESLRQNYPEGSHGEGLPLRFAARHLQPVPSLRQRGWQATGVEALSETQDRPQLALGEDSDG